MFRKILSCLVETNSNIAKGEELETSLKKWNKFSNPEVCNKPVIFYRNEIEIEIEIT